MPTKVVLPAQAAPVDVADPPRAIAAHGTLFKAAHPAQASAPDVAPPYDSPVPRQTPISVIGGAVAGFRTFSAAVKAGIPQPKVGSIAESDQLLAASQIIPHGIVSGLMHAAADHLGAWAELADSPGEHTLLLHVNADYTLFRPVLEALTEIIWILDGDTAPARITRSLEIAKVEYRHGVALTSALKRAGAPDEKTSSAITALGEIIRSTAVRVGLDGDEFVKAGLIDPSALTRKIAARVPGPSLQTLRYWAITSAHAHGQLVSTLRFAIETPLEEPHAGGALFEPDEALIAEIVEFIGRLIAITVELLNEQGYELRKA